MSPRYAVVLGRADTATGRGKPRRRRPLDVLLLDYADGDPRAFSELYDELEPRLRGLLRTIVVPHPRRACFALVGSLGMVLHRRRHRLMHGVAAHDPPPGPDAS